MDISLPEDLSKIAVVPSSLSTILNILDALPLEVTSTEQSIYTEPAFGHELAALTTQIDDCQVKGRKGCLHDEK